MKRYLVLFLVLLTTTTAAMAEPRTRAVLVGVGDYLTLDADLQGPPNDVALMADMLVRRGVAAGDITALTDPGAQLPNGIRSDTPDRDKILSTFASAIADSQSGDTVVFYFSGHGTQAPDDNGDEQGGFDELFLPRDAGNWNGAAGDVENAIRDDDLAVLAAQAADKGVKLVGIIDACHSATGFRAVGGDSAGRARYIDPVALGIPDAPDVSAASAPPPSGEFVFLYAAQSDQRAFEYPVEDAGWYGDFTRNLVNVLLEVPDLTYEQLAQATTMRLRTRSGQAAQTPDIEGTLTGSPVFGGGAGAMRRMAVDGTTLKAGILQDITVGSTVALYASPTERDIAGRARVRAVRAAEAELELLEPYPSVRVSHAELENRAMDVSFTVALGPEAARELDHRVSGGAAMLAEALDFPLADGAANTVVWDGHRFALIGPDGVLDAFGPGTSPRLADPGSSDDLVTDLAIALTNHARKARLEQALAQMSGQSASGFSLLKSSPDVDIAVLTGALRGGRCRLTGATEPTAATAEAKHCDGLEITVTNGSSKMQDVTVLYVDGEAGITMLWPQPSLSNRIPSGEARTVKLGLRNTSGAAARETVLVLSVPAEPGSQRTVLGALAGGQMRGDGGPMAAWLSGLTDPGSSTRSLSLTPPGGDLNMHRLDLTLYPEN